MTAVTGFIRIPLSPVPITLQTLVVYLSGGLLGKRWGTISQVVFLGLGVIGLPVFAHGGGLGYILQPTFGYLLAFPLAAWIIGWWMKRKNQEMHYRTLLTAYVLGLLVINILGTVYLYFILKWIVGKPMTWDHIIWSGAIIFVPGELLKIGCAATLTKRLHRYLNIEDGML